MEGDPDRAESPAPTQGQPAEATISLSGKTVTVTGGAGLVGRHLVNALTPRNTVRVLDHFVTSDPTSLPEGIEVIRGDIRERSRLDQAIDGADIVFHQAATTGAYALEHPVASHEINSTATLRLLESCRRQDVRAIIASSAAVYGPPETLPIPEDATTNPLGPYGTQKLSAETYARQYATHYDLETVVLRYFNVYGYRPDASKRKNVVNAFLEQARRGEELTIIGDGTQTRDFVHVDDIVQANLLAAQTSNVGSVYNVGSGTETSINELAATVCDRTAATSVAHEGERRVDVQASVADLTRAGQELGYAPRVTLEGGIDQLWMQYQTA